MTGNLAAMAAVNETRQTVVSHAVKRADTFMTRLVGLLGREAMQEGEALWIVPCRGIHTMGMRFAIDALFLDNGNRVVAVREKMSPWRSTRFVDGAVSVLEVPSGMAGMARVSVGDQIAFVTNQEAS